MRGAYGLFFLIVCLLCLSESHEIKSSRQDVRKFPDGFRFGTSTASYQIEGAWDEDGKTPNIWDHMTHNEPCVIKDCSNGDVALDSYHLYKRDVEILRELGVDYYRFSLSWTRIMPNSFPDKINEAGVQYYNNLINELLKYNIEPMITLYHWDLPQKLQELGGWTNPHIVDWFGDYARQAYRLFGDRVKSWMTVNEPYQICNHGYGDVLKAPILNMKGVADYMCAKYVLLAHARAYHIYDEEFRASQGGNVFIAFSAQWYEPESENDIVAAQDCNQFLWGLYVHPIYAENGDYPPVVKQRVAAKSAAQGYPRSRLIEFTPEEIQYVRGTSDFFGLNHYTTYSVYRNESVQGYYEIPSLYDDAEVILYQKTEWSLGETDLVKTVPWGFYNLLKQIREDYNNPPVYIIENGFASQGGLMDDDRVQYIRNYMSAMLDAMQEGSDIRAYSIWSLVDNFEWMKGYTQRFGIYEVDYEAPERTRTARKSARVYKEIMRTRSLDFSFDPSDITMPLDEGH
ncbi:unnamed protein product [Chrysodeixis includens]|uniref:beta-glucosidase n=1 Tax=Chrysodeixis includens TaxID=689277 RepID=A0A9P0BY14_CHRIL|nr:unnamed protein product [Chrysodeixis includens]